MCSEFSMCLLVYIVVANQCNIAPLANPVTSKALTDSNFEGFKVGLLDISYSNVLFMQDVLKPRLLIDEPFCIPVHNIKWLLLW